VSAYLNGEGVLLFLTVSFISYFLIVKGVSFVTFLLVVTLINYFLLLRRARVKGSIHCARGELEKVFFINMLKGDGKEFIFYVEKG